METAGTKHRFGGGDVILHTKIGTMPAGYSRIRCKRSLPVIGERIYVRPEHEGRAPWEPVIVDQIKDDGHAGLFFVSKA